MRQLLPSSPSYLPNQQPTRPASFSTAFLRGPLPERSMTADPSRPQDDTRVTSRSSKMPPPQGDKKSRDESDDGNSDSTKGTSTTIASSGPFSSVYGLQDHLSQPWVRKYRTTISAGMSSVVSTAIAFPLDSVKTRMQTYKYAGFMDCLRKTYHTEGLGGFFRGRCFEWALLFRTTDRC